MYMYMCVKLCLMDTSVHYVLLFQSGFVKMNQHTLQSQFEELNGAKEELAR